MCLQPSQWPPTSHARFDTNEAANWAAHISSLRHCHVDRLFEDFHSSPFTDQKRRIVASKLLAIAKFGLPLSGVKNPATFQARDSTPHAVIVKPEIDHHSLQFASNGIPATENTGRCCSDSVFAKNPAMAGTSLRF